MKIVLVGDSTVATGGGWGPGFCAVMTPNVTCVDLALNGRSTKSFIDEGAWAKALAEKGDYYFIQFGHNDQKKNIASLYTDSETTFQDYLRRYIKDVRAIGAVPVLVTSLSRRTFKDGKVVEDLKDYAAATKKVGAEEFVTVVDLNAMSTAMLNRMGQEEADKLDKTNGGDIAGDARTAVGKTAIDRTHLNPAGQKIFGRMVADAVVRTQVELGPDVIGEPMRAGRAGLRVECRRVVLLLRRRWFGGLIILRGWVGCRRRRRVIRRRSIRRQGRRCSSMG